MGVGRSYMGREEVLDKEEERNGLRRVKYRCGGGICSKEERCSDSGRECLG